MKALNLLILIIICSLSACKQPAKEKATTTTTTAENKTKPNIIFIYADDLGYGDMSAYGATEIATPNLDRIAKEGVQFTNGYAAAATCSPSRYSVLTGSYPWRNKRARILPGTAPLLIKTNQMTLPKMLKSSGYHTAVIGKWHLGLGTGHIDWNQHISPSPNEVGFDYSYIMAATQDRVPTVYIKNGDVVNLDKNDPIEVNYRKNFKGEPTALTNPEMLKMTWSHGHNNSIINGIPRIGFMKGGEKAKWVDETMADTFLKEAQNYVEKHKDEPFFLYYALQQPHVPRTPNARFVGRTTMGPRGDVIVEADWCVGELLKTLEQQGILENTLVILSSDNGPVLDDGYNDDAVKKIGKHKPAGSLRGGKYSLFEAGTRVPFATYWKGTIKPKKSNAIVSQVDLLASMAALVGNDLKGDFDSENMLNAFLGKTEKGRNNLLLQAGSKTALRKGDWKYIPPHKGAAMTNKFVNIETGNSTEYQLYNLKDDVGEQKNLGKTNPEKLKELMETYKMLRGDDSK